MATSIPTTLLFKWLAQLTPDGDEGGGPIIEFGFDEALASGNSARQALIPFKTIRPLGAGASETINLQGLTDANGVAMTVAEVVLFVVSVPESALAGILLDDSPASPWIALFSSSAVTDDGQLTCIPGGFIIAMCVLDPAYPVTAGSRQFLVTNLDGANGVSYTLGLLTRAA